jgi:hypothetical protein
LPERLVRLLRLGVPSVGEGPLPIRGIPLQDRQLLLPMSESHSDIWMLDQIDR